MDKCPICLEDLDAASPVLSCGHRCHASCLGQLADANGSAPTRRGLVIACPSCRQKSRVAAPTPIAAFGLGDRVEALWGQRWYPGVVDAVLDGGRAYEIIWDDGDEGEVRAAHVRAAPAPARTVATPRNTEPQVAPARLPRRPAPPAVSPPVLNEDSDDDGIEAEEQRVAALQRQLEDAKRALQEKQDRKKRKRESEPAAESPAAETCMETHAPPSSVDSYMHRYGGGPFTAPCGFTYDGAPTAALVPADESRKKYISFCCAASGKPVEDFVCMNVKTIKKNLKLAKGALPFASRTVQSSLPPKLKHVEFLLAACQEAKASMLKCNIKCRASVHDMIQFRKTLSVRMLPPEFAHHRWSAERRRPEGSESKPKS